MGVPVHTELGFLRLGTAVPVLPWQETAGARCSAGAGSAARARARSRARSRAGRGDSLVPVCACSGRTRCAGAAGKHTGERGEGAEPCLKIQTCKNF